jgi:hypothetical protein
MRRSLPAVLLRTILLSLFVCGNLFCQDPKVRTSLDTRADLWVGQRVTLVVELLAPGFFSGAPAFDLPNAPGMLLVPPSGSPVVSSEMIEGTAYTVQRHEVSVFAHKVGAEVIPPITVRFQFKRHPLDKEPEAVRLKTGALRFTTKAPAGAERLGGMISARHLEVVEKWSPEPGKAKAGDAFTRTITFTAPDVPGMAFPPFPADEIDGLGIYPKPPEVLDQSDRGNLTGRRRDTVIYVCQRPGEFVIPATQLTWFDLNAQKLKTIEFPARKLAVAPNASLASGEAAVTKAASDDERSLLFALCAALGLNGLVILIWKFRSVWQPCIDAFRPVVLSPLNPGG